MVCGVLYAGFEGRFYMSGLKGFYSSLESVSLVESTSSDREVELIALGDAELGVAEYVFLNSGLSRLQ